VDDTIAFKGNENVNAIPDGMNAETEVFNMDDAVKL